MRRTNGWARGEPMPLAVQVTASVALGVVLMATGALRAAGDVPMSIALVTMGVALLAQAVAQLRRRPSRAAGDEASGRLVRLGTE